MNVLHEALRAGHAKPRRHSIVARRVLVAGGGGALGAAVLERLLASRRVARQSESLGRESPLGWLCASTIPALPCWAASAMIALNGKDAPVSSPA